ncbi:MAG: RNA polymerase subunit sigma-70 [Bacteroidia bacterium]|nr:MAG: RNA polymerase subunit sigma-70 [Bacteroidia bacterium]
MEAKTKFWEDTYRKNISKMIGICYRYVSNREIAEDLAHDAFLKAFDKVETFRNKGRFGAWLYKITVNTALKYLRDNKLTKEKNIIYEENLYINDEIQETPWSNFTSRELLEIINKLPENHRLVFNLYALDNLQFIDCMAFGS